MLYHVSFIFHPFPSVLMALVLLSESRKELLISTQMVNMRVQQHSADSNRKSTGHKLYKRCDQKGSQRRLRGWPKRFRQQISSKGRRLDFGGGGFLA